MLGRAEMQLGNSADAVGLLKRAVAIETDPEFLQQSWYQLGIAYRRLHRMTEAQDAMATFQRLKTEQEEASQNQLKRFEVHQDDHVAQPSTQEPDANSSQN